MSRTAPGSRPDRDPRRRRARRFAVRLQQPHGERQVPVLRRLLGPSSWRCHPHASPHPAGEPLD